MSRQHRFHRARALCGEQGAGRRREVQIFPMRHTHLSAEPRERAPRLADIRTRLKHRGNLAPPASSCIHWAMLRPMGGFQEKHSVRSESLWAMKRLIAPWAVPVPRVHCKDEHWHRIGQPPWCGFAGRDQPSRTPCYLTCRWCFAWLRPESNAFASIPIFSRVEAGVSHGMSLSSTPRLRSCRNGR